MKRLLTVMMALTITVTLNAQEISRKIGVGVKQVWLLIHICLEVGD